jgi:hypothetical protein
MPNQSKITNKSIMLAAPGRHHAGAKGLYLYVTPGGDTRRWIYRYVSPTTRRPTETGLGLWPEVALADAKDKADAMRRQIANGVCPIHAKRTERQACVTFEEACNQWIATHQSA